GRDVGTRGELHEGHAAAGEVGGPRRLPPEQVCHLASGRGGGHDGFEFDRRGLRGCPAPGDGVGADPTAGDPPTHLAYTLPTRAAFSSSLTSGVRTSPARSAKRAIS